MRLSFSKEKTMKRITTLLFTLCSFVPLLAQTWTAEQLASANTADSVASLSQEEKDVILFVNLVRLYPQDFLKYEVNDDSRIDRAYITLRQTLKVQKPLTALTYNAELQDLAKCFAEEQSHNGRTGHKRKSCSTGYWGECLAYGDPGGRNIVLQLLIDENVPDYGHRKMCLSKEASQIGVATAPHPKYARVSVLDFFN